jgi:hypothetical protein
MIFSLVVALKARDRSTAPQPPRAASAIAAIASVAALLLLLATVLAIFPIVEEGPIWNTELEGWILDWWVGYGGILGVLSSAFTAWALRPKVLADEGRPRA